MEHHWDDPDPQLYFDFMEPVLLEEFLRVDSVEGLHAWLHAHELDIPPTGAPVYE